LRNEVSNESRGDGCGALFIDFRADPCGDGDIKIGSREFKAAAVSLKEDVGRDWQRGARGNGSADDREAALKVFLEELDFHVFTRLIHFEDRFVV
jgi:hypothetical protein